MNGIQTLSQAVQAYCPTAAEAASFGVRRLRLSPHTADMAQASAIYRDLLDGAIEPAAARSRLAALGLPGTLIDGYTSRESRLRTRTRRLTALACRHRTRQAASIRLLDRDRNFRGGQCGVVRDVVAVADNELERVLAGRQRKLRPGLSLAEVFRVLVHGQRIQSLFPLRQIPVHKDVVMTGRWLIRSGRRNIDAFDPHRHLDRAGDRIAVFRRNEVDLRIGGPMRLAGFGSDCGSGSCQTESGTGNEPLAFRCNPPSGQAPAQTRYIGACTPVFRRRPITECLKSP